MILTILRYNALNTGEKKKKTSSHSVKCLSDYKSLPGLFLSKFEA